MYKSKKKRKVKKTKEKQQKKGHRAPSYALDKEPALKND